MSQKKVAFFASGSGSNLENIVLNFKEKGYDHQYLIFCNKPDAFVLERAKKLQIRSIVFDKADLRESEIVLNHLKTFQPDLIVLAGFLWLMPLNIIQHFPNRIINIHPALLPAYGGKGMYGMRVHEAVVLNKEKQSGITIHYVNEHYDEGKCQRKSGEIRPDVGIGQHHSAYRFGHPVKDARNGQRQPQTNYCGQGRKPKRRHEGSLMIRRLDDLGVIANRPGATPREAGGYERQDRQNLKQRQYH